MTSSSSTRSSLEAALSRATSAPTDADAFPLFLDALRQAAPALVVEQTGREEDGDRASKSDDSKFSSLLLSTPETRSAYDLALRSALSRAIASALQNGEPVMEHDASGSASNSSTVRRLLAVASSAATAAAASRPPADSAAATATLFAALEDLIEGTPTEEASQAFSALEEAAAEPLRRLGWDRCKLPLLRACNGLLSRASRRRSPRDCGAVLLFLARAAPLGDKSGLNLMGTYNSASHPVPVEEVDEGGGEGKEKGAFFDSSGERIDGELYKKFWKLQRFLQSPIPTLLIPASSSVAAAAAAAVTTKTKAKGGEAAAAAAAAAAAGPEATAWAEFQSSVGSALEAFRKTPIAVDAAGGSSKIGISAAAAASTKGRRRLGSASAKRRSSAGALAAPSAPSSSPSSSAAVGVSYLSSPSIFGLQLRDGAVRRHFLVQVLIALHALRHAPQRGAAAVALAGASSSAATTTPSPARARQLAEADSLEASVLSALELVPPEGRKYAAAVRAALAREASWAAWKASNPPCPSLERAPAKKLKPSDDGAAAAATATPPPSLPASSLSTSIKRRPGGLGAPGPPALGTPDLDRLWSLTPSNGAGLGAAARGVVPSVEAFLGPVLSEMDPEEGIEDFYKTQRDQVYQWKALRQMAAEDWRAFAAVVGSPGASDLEAGAASMFPSRVPRGWVSAAAKEEAKAKLKKEEEERERAEREKREKEEAAAAAAKEAAKAEAEKAKAKAEESPAAADEIKLEGETAGGAIAAATARAGAGKRKRSSEDEAGLVEEEEEKVERKQGGEEEEMTDVNEEEEEAAPAAAAAPLAPAEKDDDEAIVDGTDASLSQQPQQQSDEEEEEEEMEVEEEEEEGALAAGDDEKNDEPSQPGSEGVAAAGQEQEEGPEEGEEGEEEAAAAAAEAEEGEGDEG